MCQRLGTPNTPANPFHAGGEFRGFHGSLICYGLPGCSAPCTDLTGFPAIGAFYFQASNEIGPLLDITTASTGLLCWRDFHPQEWQLDSLHGTLAPSTVVQHSRRLLEGKRTCRTHTSLRSCAEWRAMLQFSGVTAGARPRPASTLASFHGSGNT